MKSASELQQTKVAAYKRARAACDKAKTEGRDLSEDEQRTVDDALADMRVADMEQAEIEMSKSTGRVTGLMDDASVRTLKPGELRTLKPSEKLSEVHPVRDDFAGLDLGRVVRGMAGLLDNPSTVESRALSTFTDSLGGFAVPSSVSQNIIDAARNAARVVQAGALTFNMDAAKVLVPTLDSDVSASWKPEGQEGGESTATLGAIEFQSRSLFFWLELSRELAQDGVGLSDTLMSSIAAAAGLALDHACLMGSGSGAEPTGLYNTPGVTKTAATTAPYDDISDGIYRVQNANYEPNAIILSPKSLNALRKRKDGEGLYLKQPEWCPEILSTKQVSDTLGTGVNESCAFAGQWNRMLLGVRDTLRLEILREIKAQKGNIVLMGMLRADVAAVRPAAFQVISGIKTATWGT